jgi:hypothetical protein
MHVNESRSDTPMPDEAPAARVAPASEAPPSRAVAISDLLCDSNSPELEQLLAVIMMC